MSRHTRKNRYLKRTHLSEPQFRVLLREFSRDSTASETSLRTGLNRNTVNRIFTILRRTIALESEGSGVFSGEVEVDECYFGARRVRGKRGRGARGKVPVIGLLKRGGSVYTRIIPNCTKKQLMPIIQGKVLEGSTIHTDGWRSYDGLIVNGYKHYRVYHSKDEFVRGKSHINGIESFWSFAKRRLAKFNGVKKSLFMLHLKESEFRWNHHGENLYLDLLRLVREKSL